jgi:creatinine amidohydrolase
MRVADLSWMQLEEHLKRDDRAVLPIGSTEQHAYLSLATDAILAERVALEAAEPLGIPVFPVLAYGLTPYFMAFPGTVTFSQPTYFTVVREILDSLATSGFRRIAIVNGHGGNVPVAQACREWASARPDCRVRFHSWWNAPKTIACVKAIDPVASHASWMESFPWTRVPGNVPGGSKEPLDFSKIAGKPVAEIRKSIGDGSFGGRYQRPDSDMEAIWKVAVEETREVLAANWS